MVVYLLGFILILYNVVLILKVLVIVFFVEIVWELSGGSEGRGVLGY